MLHIIDLARRDLVCQEFENLSHQSFGVLARVLPECRFDMAEDCTLRPLRGERIPHMPAVVIEAADEHWRSARRTARPRVS